MQKYLTLTNVLLKKISYLQIANIFQLSVKLNAIKMSTNNNIQCNATNANNNFSGMIKFLELVGNLKHIKRTGWVMRNVTDCETVAGHMYRMGMMTFLLDGGAGLDRIKCMELALVHDLAESVVGDITPYCGISKEEKKLREQNAMEDIAKLIDDRGDYLLSLFNEYEANESPESKFVKDLDRFDMILQAFEYEKRDNCPNKHQEFFDSTNGKINHPLVINLVNEIKLQRQLINDNNNNNINNINTNNLMSPTITGNNINDVVDNTISSTTNSIHRNDIVSSTTSGSNHFNNTTINATATNVDVTPSNNQQTSS